MLLYRSKVLFMPAQTIVFSDVERSLRNDRHDSFVRECVRRVFPQFNDIAEESSAIFKGLFERNRSELKEVTEQELFKVCLLVGSENYRILADVRDSVYMGVLAGTYHQWEKEIKDFLCVELRAFKKNSWINNKIIRADFDNLVSLMERFGWNLSSEPFFAKLKSLHLVVNVYKHGNGRSVTELAKHAPQYLIDPCPISPATSVSSTPDHTWLAVDESMFHELSGTVKAFWLEMPEFLCVPD